MLRDNLEVPHVGTDTTTIVTWNILMDKTRSSPKKSPGDWDYIVPQHIRLASHAETLRSLGISLDVVAIQEAQKTKEQHNGEELARLLGFEASFWYEHNRGKRKGEHIGMFGHKVAEVAEHELPHDKKMVLTLVGDVAICGIHNRREFAGPKRYEQMKEIVKLTNDYDRLVVVGDANDHPHGRSLAPLRRAGLQAARNGVVNPHPATFPTKQYRRKILGEERIRIDEAGTEHRYGAIPLTKMVVARGLPLDIMFTRGVETTECGIFEGDSDHKGRWITIQAT